MARGDLTVFEEFALEIGLETFNLETDVLKMGIVDATITPSAGDGTPTWSDYSANEVSTAGGYTAGGEIIENNTYTESSGVGTLNGDDIVIAQNASGFTDGYWGILYSDTASSDNAFAFLDLGGPVSEVAGPITVTWNASGILTVTVA